jgi:preprotein translocase subunit SecD
MEANTELPDTSSPVPIFRENPIMVNADKDPILTEAEIKSAKIVNVLGGFAIQITFSDQGRWMLEQYTASNQGRRIAILCHWDKKLKETRWIAAPTISRRISNGILTFTPDATREESEKIVLGLNNMAKRSNKKADEW